MDDVAIAAGIISTLQEKAKGMFLWVALTLEELKKPRFDESELFETLKYLPEDLDTLFYRILQNIHPRDRSTSRNLLQLLLFAQRPLSIQEIGAAMRVSVGENRLKARTLMPDERLRETILYYCGPLVSIYRAADGHSIVTLVHFTLKEYLLNDVHTHADRSRPFQFNPQEAHGVFAQICLTYLCYDNIDPMPFAIREQEIVPTSGMIRRLSLHLQRYPLLEYSSLCWWWHVHRSSGDPSIYVALCRLCNSAPSTIRWLQILLAYRSNQTNSIACEDFKRIIEIKDILAAPEQAMFSSWLRIFGRSSQCRSSFPKWRHFLVIGVANEFLPEIHMASFFNMSEAVEQYLDAGVDVNQRSRTGNTPISLAATGDSIDCLKILIHRGGDVNSVNIFDDSPLWDAIGCPSWSKALPTPYTTANILLEAGASPSLCRGRAFAKLCSISFPQDPFCLSLVTKMLEHGATRVIDEGQSFTPLQWSAKCRNATLAKLLLDYGANVDAGTRTHNTETALLHTCAVTTPNAAEIVEVLLGAGASVSARLNGGRSALHLSARHPAQVSKLLLNAGAEVDAQSQDGNTPLHDAVTEGNIEMIDLLIFYSASLDLKNNIQHTPLTLAIESKNFSMIKKLNDAGATLNEFSRPHDEKQMYQPSQPRDIIQVFLILQSCAREALTRHIITKILDFARYWLLSRVSREDHISIDEEGCGKRTPYLVSKPIHGGGSRVREINVSVRSHDQGFSSYRVHHGTFEASWTWFDLGIERPPGKNAIFGEKGMRLATNVHASKVFRHHQIIYRSTQKLDWMQKLQAGDKISIIPMARFPAWRNFVGEASIAIYTTCLMSEPHC